MWVMCVWREFSSQFAPNGSAGSEAGHPGAVCNGDRFGLCVSLSANQLARFNHSLPTGSHQARPASAPRSDHCLERDMKRAV